VEGLGTQQMKGFAQLAPIFAVKFATGRGLALVKTRKLVAILVAERRHGCSLSTHRDVRRRELECPFHVDSRR
jgi:hypothetical protein